MSQADALYRATCLDILEHGVWDTEQAVRPRWEDGTPAHTIKKFGVVNRYDLREEFPIMTLRRTAFRNCVEDLAEKIQQCKRPAQPRLGQLGR